MQYTLDKITVLSQIEAQAFIFPSTYTVRPSANINGINSNKSRLACKWHLFSDKVHTPLAYKGDWLHSENATIQVNNAIQRVYT